MAGTGGWGHAPIATALGGDWRTRGESDARAAVNPSAENGTRASNWRAADKDMDASLNGGGAMRCDATPRVTGDEGGEAEAATRKDSAGGGAGKDGTDATSESDGAGGMGMGWDGMGTCETDSNIPVLRAAGLIVALSRAAPLGGAAEYMRVGRRQPRQRVCETTCLDIVGLAACGLL